MRVKKINSYDMPFGIFQNKVFVVRNRQEIPFVRIAKSKSGCRHKICWIQPSLRAIPGDFCQNTSLHGLKYISQPERHISERLFWIIVFIIGLATAVYLISDVWRKYNGSPIIVSLDPDLTIIDHLPFPAVTICNNNKILKSQGEKVASVLQDDLNNTEALKNYYYLTEVCLTTKSFSNKFGFSQFPYNETLFNMAHDRIEEYTQSNQTSGIQDFVREKSQSCPLMIPLCRFKDETVNCSDIFNPIVTDSGKCCTFNMRPNLLRDSNNTFTISEEEVIEWDKAQLSSSGLLSDGEIPTAYPRRQRRAGKSFGLSILLNPDVGLYCPNSDSDGFRLSIHLPFEIPNSVDFGYGIPPNSEVSVILKPQITKADPSIYGYSLAKRRCYFNNEYNLTFYKYYSVSNCIDECVSEHVYEVCGCVRFYMARDLNRNLCDPIKFNCTESARANFSDDLETSCAQCLPLCNEIHFNAQTTSTPIGEGVWTESKGPSPEWQNHKVSIVHIYFDQASTIASLRKELFGFTDLVANTGGLMGLCLGFSALSGVELIYFLTLRNLCSRKRKQSIRHRVVELWKKSANWYHNNKQRSSKLRPTIMSTRKTSVYSFKQLRDQIFGRTHSTELVHNGRNQDLSIIDQLANQNTFKHI